MGYGMKKEFCSSLLCFVSVLPHIRQIRLYIFLFSFRASLSGLQIEWWNLLPINELMLCIIWKSKAMWERRVDSGLWVCRTPGLPAASIWALSELPVSCRWGKALSEFWMGLVGLLTDPRWAQWSFLLCVSPFCSSWDFFDLCKGRASRQGWWW